MPSLIDGRLIEVVIHAPAGAKVLNVQELAEKAWWSMNKSIAIGGAHGR
jgi:hypothetical protein